MQSRTMDLTSHGGRADMPIPMPLSSKYASTNGPPPTSADHQHMKEVRYRECLKNHAAAIGGNATDGCGEFMPTGDDGSIEALKCSACGCHRNFHRRETEGGSELALLPSPPPHLYDHPHQHHYPLLYHHHHHQYQRFKGSNGDALLNYNTAMYQQHHMVMPIGAVLQTSESDEINEGIGGAARKRFRTKFTQEQKEKMLGFAERVGWRLQRQEESEVQRFCQEIGVKRRVLKVWMHNNKHNLAKKDKISANDNGNDGGNVVDVPMQVHGYQHAG